MARAAGGGVQPSVGSIPPQINLEHLSDLSAADYSLLTSIARNHEATLKSSLSGALPATAEDRHIDQGALAGSPSFEAEY
jgi:hypothetical protein